MKDPAAKVDAPAPHPLDTPQTTRATIRFGDRFLMESEVRMTPLGLLAVGGMVAAILLATAPLVHARYARKALPPPRS
ncbi:hypothetical protein IAG41_20000 [Sphingomonas sp. JC676]|uniref:hypothetical protein n=1 Tax=Sphingomonas sp. JC676 TaxID=2768065 RepID=UPI0016586FA7|nr:hypothetical protein [Sphingomonas sp. JC676]MBC9034678.1 hypothetical protein [Sphingomonas sp. JC676]